MVMTSLMNPLRSRKGILDAARLGMGVLALVAGVAGTASAQGVFTKADSGWVPLFNGKDFTGIYSRLYSQAVTETPDPSWVILYPGTDTATIRGSSTSKQGNIGTKKNYSHYRMRVEYRHDVAADGNNAGITYHTDESKARMNNNWPFSIECQMMQRESGSAYSIAGLAFDTRANGGTYAPTGGSAATGCEGSGCTARNFLASPIIKGGTHWQEMEIIVRGSDTAWHLVKDQVVFKLWNLRVKTSSGFGDKVTSGGIGLQAEGALINYRRWEIMELPAGTPAPHILNRYFVTSPDSGEKLTPGGVHKITWKSIGSAGKASLQYNTGTGWKPVTADSVPNNGSYDWTVPAENTQTLRVRVSGPSWVMADSSNANNSIGPGTGIRAMSRNPGFATIAGLVAKDGDILEIRGLDGRLVRSIIQRAGGDGIIPSWDLRDDRGRSVRPGIYLAKLSGAPDVARLLVH